MEGPRPVRPDEFDSLMELINTVFSSHQGRMRDAFPLLFNCRNWENLFVFVDNGRVVSHVGLRLDEILILGCRLTVASIGAVGTYDDYRGRHLATQCLQAAETKAISAGASVTYISGSRGLYSRFGATKVGKSFVYSFAAGDAGPGIVVREATADDLFKTERTYEREPVRFHRPLEDWRAAFAAILGRYGTNFQDFLFLLGDAGDATGYVLVRRSHWGEKPVVRVTEYAGARPYIVGALPAVAAVIGADAVELAVPDYDAGLRRAAALTGIVPRTDFLLGHTIKVSSLASFVRGVRPLIEERLGRTGAGGLAFQVGSGGTYDVIVGEEHFPFPVQAFTTLAFGSPQADTLDGAAFGGGELGRMFPVPLPLPGLNYV
jgi:predicted N-acetyltransferase YhbS